MKIFEFQFNPNAKRDRFFHAVSYEAPQEMLERGNMYIVGELQNALPNNSTFLKRLSEFLRAEYYSEEKSTQNVSQRLKNTLKKANDFLAEETKNGNVDWLGNLHFLLLLLVPSEQGHTLYFTKVGAIKLWMARSSSLVDAGKSVESAKKDEGPGKTFGNVGSGKVIPGDRIMVLTKEAFEFFSKENFLQTIAQLKEEKQFKNIFKSKQKEMLQLSGILFFVLVEGVRSIKESNERGFSLPQFSMPAFPKRVSLPRVPLPDFAFVKKKLPSFMVSEAKRRMGILALFLFLLILGFAVFGGRQKNANDVADIQGQKEMSEELRVLHKITELAAPEVAAELNPVLASADLQHMLQLGNTFYFFGPSSPNIVIFDKAANTQETLNAGKNLKFGTSFENSLLFFAEPNTIVLIDEQNAITEHAFSSLAPELQLEGMEQFGGNLYFFDSRNGEILKSPIPSIGEVRIESWLDPLSLKKPINAQAMGIDGNIWILTAENEVQRYFKGRYQESINLEVFPQLRTATVLETSSQLPNLYILDPQEGRVVILSKSGEVVRQYQSEAFKHARDFAVSAADQAIYLFDGLRVYQISLIEE